MSDEQPAAMSQQEFDMLETFHLQVNEPELTFLFHILHSVKQNAADLPDNALPVLVVNDLTDKIAKIMADVVASRDDLPEWVTRNRQN